MKTTKIFIGLGACVAFVVLAISLSCGKGNATEATDYSIPAHWLSIPTPNYKEVDVFYLYPTAWSNTNPNPEICAIDNPSMLKEAPEAFARQATAFQTIANIYAPFYRQDNSSPIDRLNTIAGIPTLDAVAAFEYYINNYNNGRPYILAGHSQGSDVMSNLLARYMKDHPEVYTRMIAAYVIGFPITAQYLADNPHLKFAEGPDDTGVIISYDTQALDVPPGTNPVLSGMVGVVINPITWTRCETLAPKRKGLGSFLPDAEGVYTKVPQYADAKVDKKDGVLICSTADENAIAIINKAQGFPRGVYHSFDYPFYYYNIRQNAANRTQIFLNTYGIGPVGEIVLNGPSFARGDFFSATFQLDRSITQRFTAYAAVIMPDGSMLDARTLGPNLKPVGKKVRRLDAPFQYSLLSLNIPASAPLGQYEVVAAFFDPSKPIMGLADAALEVSATFTIR